jgi:hypothetical protein
MRAFPFRYQGRLLRVVVVAVQEAWQLWVCEEERRVAYGGRVSVDDAIAGWRVGDDRVLELAEEVKSNVLIGKLALDAAARDDDVTLRGDDPLSASGGGRRTLDDG